MLKFFPMCTESLEPLLEWWLKVFRVVAQPECTLNYRHARYMAEVDLLSLLFGSIWSRSWLLLCDSVAKGGTFFSRQNLGRLESIPPFPS